MTIVHDSSDFAADATAFLDRFDLGPLLERPDGADPADYLAASLIVGGPRGARMTTRQEYVAGVAERASAVGSARPRRIRHEATPLGETFGLITATWELALSPGDDAPRIRLIADLLVDRTASPIQCLAYLVRQDIMSELARIAAEQR